MNTGPILITGAGGFIGAHIARELTGRALPVIALTRANTSRLDSVPGIKIIQVDITDFDALRHLINDAHPAVVINAASYGVLPGETDEGRMRAVNVDAAQTLARAARDAGAKRFIQLGSYFEYGDHAEKLSEDTACYPKTVYAATKAEASALLSTAETYSPMETLVLRLFNVWGPGEHPHRLIPSVIHACRTVTPLDLTSGLQIKDFAFAPDLARWIADIALSPRPYAHRIVNLPAGNAMAVKDLVLSCARMLGGEHLMRFGAKTMPGGEPQVPSADTTRRDALLPHLTRTPLETAIAATIAAYDAAKAP